MTDRGLPIVDGAPACPFVAFEDDRDGRGQAPDHRHRCFAEPRPAPRALAHQEAYCLSSAFPVCPTFQDWARREAATARAAQQEAEAEAPVIEEPVSQSLPPRALEAHHPPSTDTPPPLPPRRNPPRAWADPPPWAGDMDGEPAEPPSFLAARPPEPSDQRAAEAAAWGAASRGLAGSAADRLAGGYVDDADEPVAGSPSAYEAASYGAPIVNDPNDRYRPPAKAAAAAAAGSAAAYAAGNDASSKPAAASSGRSSRPAGQASPAPATRKPAAAPKPQDPAELFGPAWEAPRRYEAYPSLRTRVGLPSFGGISRLGVAAVAVVLAALALFFVGPMLLGIGGSNPGGGGGAPAASHPAEELTPTPIPTEKPAPTPQVYIVARGDTMLKIAKKFGVTMEALLAANPKIKNPNKIGIGDSVNIPVPQQGAGGGNSSVSGGSPAP